MEKKREVNIKAMEEKYKIVELKFNVPNDRFEEFAEWLSKCPIIKNEP